MPRTRANPDPLVETYTRRDGKVFEIRAWRRGAYGIFRDGEPIYQTNDTLQGFPGHRYPSNRRQADAMEAAKTLIDARGDW